jgi:hypothetical protein
MDHHHEYYIRNYHTAMSKEDMLANAQPMPMQALVEVAVDSISAQLAYDGSWPTENWVWLKRINRDGRYHYHPASRALLCAIWCGIGFEGPLRDDLGGWKVALELSASAPQLQKHVRNLQVFVEKGRKCGVMDLFLFLARTLAPFGVFAICVILIRQIY